MCSKILETQGISLYPIKEYSMSEKLLDLSQGTKDDSEKVEFYLLESESIEELAKVLQYGAKKYAPYNWKKGIKFSRVFSAILRHLWAWWRGQTFDPETGLNHMAHVMCNAMFLNYYNNHSKYNEFDDRDFINPRKIN